jgi:hypothetical protein
MLNIEREVHENEIYQAELVPNHILELLLVKYRNRWPLRETPGCLGKLLEVLE